MKNRFVLPSQRALFKLLGDMFLEVQNTTTSGPHLRGHIDCRAMHLPYLRSDQTSLEFFNIPGVALQELVKGLRF